jgi:para-nitrobenzyl esterase
MLKLSKRGLSSRLHKATVRGGLKTSLALGLTLSAAALLAPIQAHATGAPIVQTNEGRVQGFLTKGITEFLGIPYAAPPLSTNPTAPPCSPTNLRWCPPVSHAPWHNVLQATAFGPTCAQISEHGVYAGPPNNNEDCLYLNVFTPAIGANGNRNDNNEKLPVIFWNHGAGETSGESNDYDGSKLALQGRTVVVTLNFRLNLFGFLAHPALDQEGHLFANYQILDNQFALRWVKQNIANFGGDPNNVTISGQSGGAQNSATEMVSPLAAGLFNKAILESGPIDPVSVPLSVGEARGVAFAVAAGCGSGTGPTVAACLRALPAATIESSFVGNGVTYTALGVTQATGSSPYLSSIITDGQIVPIDPVTAFETGKFNHVPIISGDVENEGVFSILPVEYLESPRTALTEAQFEANITSKFTGDAGPMGSPPVYPPGTVAAVLAHYPLSNYPSPELQWAAVDTDSGNGCPAPHFDHILANQVPVYAYEFRDQTMPDYFPSMPGMVTLAYHTGDIAYYFPLYHGYDGVVHPLNAAQEVLSGQLVAAWSNFAWTGNPNGPSNSNKPWPRYTGTNPLWLTENIVPAGLSTETDAFFAAEHQCAFWDTVLVYQSTAP